MHAFDRQTDGQTDGRTDGQKSHRKTAKIKANVVVSQWPCMLPSSRLLHCRPTWLLLKKFSGGLTPQTPRWLRPCLQISKVMICTYMYVYLCNTVGTCAIFSLSLFSLFRQLILTMRFRQAFSIYFDLWPEPLLLLNLHYIVPNLLLHYQSTFSFAVLCFCFLGCAMVNHKSD